MGDRGNIKVYMGADETPIYLYTHDRGSEIYGVVKRALAKRERWNDAVYLARILFCELIKGREAENTGFGISSMLTDNNHTIIALDCDTQEVLFEERDGEPKGRMSFEDMVTKRDKWSDTL